MEENIKIKSTDNERKDRILVIIQENTKEGQYRFQVEVNG